MMQSKRTAARFSLLLLDENEFYIREFVATCTWPSDVQGNWQGKQTITGQLRLCTKSLFFEADDIRIPIVRLPFIYMEQLEGIGKQGISIQAQRWIKMKANAADEPYTFEKGRLTQWSFELSYAALSDFMPLAQQMLVASRLPPSDQDSFLDHFVMDIRKDIRFDPGHLHSPSLETIILELPVMLLTPLIKEPGCLAITSSRLYFQPLHNISGDTAVRSHALSSIAAVARRRSALRDIGLEIFFIPDSSITSGSSNNSNSMLNTAMSGDRKNSMELMNWPSSLSRSSSLSSPTSQSPMIQSSSVTTWGSSSAFFSYQNTTDRDVFFSTIMKQESLGKNLPGGKSDASTCCSILEADTKWLTRVTKAWQRGALSNYEYLLYCNIAAGRSFNDLTQYPIFPWVLTDYTSDTIDILHDSTVYRDLSKPIGALNSSRLQQYKERYHDMALDPEGDPPFLYGTHYSCPGYTLYWLVRSAPAHMLRLQNGRFDAPDRLFHTVASAWESVLTNHTDVKELIPEFFMPHRCDFLLNQRRLAFGIRQDGRVVSDVELPPWSNGSPERFLSIQRAALESPYVSAHLHEWIDLIFGYKQRGEAAVDADNVFRHLTYEGAVDLSSISDPVDRMAIEVAINEFGQCPRQIFNKPHPSRHIHPSDHLLVNNTINTIVVDTKDGDDARITMQTAYSSGGGVIDSESSQHVVSNNNTVFGEESLSLALVAAIVATSTTADDDDGDNEGDDEEEQNDDVQSTINEQLEGTINKDNNSDKNTTTTSVDDNNEVVIERKNIIGKFGAIRNALGEVASKHITPSSPAAVHAIGKLSSLAGSLTSRWQSSLGYNTTNSSNSSSNSAPRGDNNNNDTIAHNQSLPQQQQDDDNDNNDNITTLVQNTLTSSPITWKRASSKTTTTSSQQLINTNDWGDRLHDRFVHNNTITTDNDQPINAVAITPSPSQSSSMYAVNNDGMIRIFDLSSAQQLHASTISQHPLTSITLLQPPSLSSSSSIMTSAVMGCYDGCVYIHHYPPSLSTNNHHISSFLAHDDTVSCINIQNNDTTSSSTILVTASWDASIKTWSLDQGRDPFHTNTNTIIQPQPIITIDTLPGGVWSLALAASTPTALVGTDEGTLVYIDLRHSGHNNNSILWQQSMGHDYIGGVCFTPDENYAVAACADGCLSLLDIRMSGQIVSSITWTSPLRCCMSDGGGVLAGSESGDVLFWNVNKQQQQQQYGGDDDGGLYDVLSLQPVSPVNAMGWSRMGDRCWFVTGHESGVLKTYYAVDEK